MPSDLPRTIVLDVSKFPAAVSRVEMSSAIVNRFTAYKVNAVQFVGNLARVTFSSASDRDAVMRLESVRVGDVDCVVRGGGPRPQKVFVYGYPVEGNSNLLTDALSRYGEVHDVRFRHWLHMSEVADGVRVVPMVRNQAIPRNLEVDGYHCKVSYYGQAKECDICEKTGHIAKDCPFRGKCLRCGQAGHLYRDCRNEPIAATTPGPRELPVDPEDNRSGEAIESDSLVNRTVPPLILSLQVLSPRMDLYPFAAGPSANVLGFLKAVILAMLIIVWLMIIMAILPVVKTARPLILLLMMLTVIVKQVTAVLQITALPV